MIPKSRRGLLLAEENLKIVIAVISISFLIYFLVALYFNNVKSQNLEKAENILLKSDQSLRAVIEILNKGDSKEFIIENPKGWYLFGFTESRPNSCSGQNCICICDKVVDVLDRQVNECSINGVCLKVPDLKSSQKIEIRNPKEGLTELIITKDSDGKILIEEKKDAKTALINSENPEKESFVASIFSDIGGRIRRGVKGAVEFFGGKTESSGAETSAAGVKA